MRPMHTAPTTLDFYLQLSSMSFLLKNRQSSILLCIIDNIVADDLEEPLQQWQNQNNFSLDDSDTYHQSSSKFECATQYLWVYQKAFLVVTSSGKHFFTLIVSGGLGRQGKFFALFEFGYSGAYAVKLAVYFLVWPSLLSHCTWEREGMSLYIIYLKFVYC